MDEQVLKEVYIEMVAILSKFRKCFKKDNALIKETGNLFRDALYSGGWITIEHDQIEECIHLLGENYEKARKIKNGDIRKPLMKCMCAFVNPLIFYYRKGGMMDAAGCGDHLFANLTSMDNICYFIENKLIKHRDIQLVLLLEKNQNHSMHIVFYQNPVTNEEDDYVVGYVYLIGHNGNIKFSVYSSVYSHKKIEVNTRVLYELQTLYIDETYGEINCQIDTQMWADSGYDLRGI
ncbi:MAG: hypothetical protein SPF87_03135 [Bacilli bacterium]|nr:hypothetical protein [Bacilli bacterium]